MGRRFLLAAGLIIAVVVPSAAFGVTASFGPKCDPRCDPPINSMARRAREWEEQTGLVPELLPVQSQMPDGRVDDSRYVSGRTHHRQLQVRKKIAIDAAVRHRRWHFNDLVLDAVGHTSNERIDATINFRGKFRKHNKNKADGTLEVTLEGGGTYLYPSGTPPIVTEQPIAGSEWQEMYWGGSGPEDCHGVQDFHIAAP